MACALPIKNLCVVSSTPEAKEAHLHRLIDMTYGKIDELKKLLRTEGEILQTDVEATTLAPILERQSQLMERVSRMAWLKNPVTTTLATEDYDRTDSGTVGLSSSGSSSNVKKHSHSVSFNLDNQFNKASPSRSDRIPMKDRGNIVEEGNSPDAVGISVANISDQYNDTKDSSWYGSLDRNFSNKKRRSGNVGLNKKRRHTKTVGSMAGLDIIKRSQELQPDEQYEIGLPEPRVTSFPTSKMTPIHATLSHSQLPHGFSNSRSSTSVGAGSSNSSRWAHPQLPPGWGPRYSPAGSITPIMSPRSYYDSVSMSPASPRPPVVPARVQSLSQQSSHSRQHSFSNNSGGGMGIAGLSQHDSSYGEESTGSYYSAREDTSKEWQETDLDGSITRSATMTANVEKLSPPSNIDSSSGSGVSFSDAMEESFSRMNFSSSMNDVHTTVSSSKSSDTGSITGGLTTTNESTKPFEMSDYYKYSAKFRNQSHLGKVVSSGERHLKSSSVLDSEPLSAERREMLIEYFTNSWTPESESWIHPTKSSSQSVKQEMSGSSSVGVSHPKTSKAVVVETPRNVNRNRIPGRPTPKLSKDMNGNNNSSDVPELPPRLRRDAKPIQQQQKNSNEKSAWVMDTPTFV